jgi:hypothetical protein
MVGAIWSNGTPLTVMRRLIDDNTEAAVKRGEEVISTVVEDAHADQVQILRDATTGHGVQRFSKGKGNGPGRDDTGRMIAGIGHGVTRGRDWVRGWWGWDKPDEYFPIQDGIDNPGTRIPAANSLVLSFQHAEQDYIKRARAIGQGF